MVMLIRVDHSNEFENENTPEDASLARYAILNIACELLGASAPPKGSTSEGAAWRLSSLFQNTPPQRGLTFFLT